MNPVQDVLKTFTHPPCASEHSRGTPPAGDPKVEEHAPVPVVNPPSPRERREESLIGWGTLGRPDWLQLSDRDLIVHYKWK